MSVRRVGGVIALGLVLAAVVTAAPAAASKPVKRFKVVAGWVHQTVFWHSRSSADDGCYTINHNDNGSFSIDLTAKEGRVVTLGYDDEPRGFVFEGTMRKNSTFRISLVPKPNKAPDCPSPDSRWYQPPSTSGCEGGARRRASEAANYLFLREEYAGPRLALFGVFAQPDNCPSEDSYAVAPIGAESNVTVEELRRAKARITLEGRSTSRALSRGSAGSATWTGAARPTGASTGT